MNGRMFQRVLQPASSEATRMVYMYGHNPKLDSTLRALRWLLSWHDHESSSLAKSCSIGEWGTRLHGTTHQRSFALLLLLPVASTINQIDIDYGRR